MSEDIWNEGPLREEVMRLRREVIELRKEVMNASVTVQELDSKWADSVRIHNAWAREVSSLQTALVRFRDGRDINRSITDLEVSVEDLHEKLRRHVPMERERARSIRQRIRQLEKRQSVPEK